MDFADSLDTTHPTATLPGVYDDVIVIRNLSCNTVTGLDEWGRQLRKQPLLVSLELHASVAAAGNDDAVSKSVHYGHVSKRVRAFAEASVTKTIEALSLAIAAVCTREFGVGRVRVRVEKPKAHLYAEGAGVQITRFGAGSKDHQRESADDSDLIFIRNLAVHTIIGCNPWERGEKQKVVVNLVIYPAVPFGDMDDHVTPPNNYRTIARVVSQYLEASQYKTVEALATSIARICVEQCHVAKVTVRVEKPSALLFAHSAGVEITRDRASFTDRKTESSKSDHIAYIALGSNLGDRAQNILKSTLELDMAGCRVVDTSYLYETPAAYVTDQPSFLNAVCKIQTALEPEPLLDLCKKIEDKLGRTPTIRHGPRTVDLDIIFYDHIEFKTKRLTIPHPLLQERAFVLRPLCDIAKDYNHPTLLRTPLDLLQLLHHTHSTTKPTEPMDPIYCVLPLRNQSEAPKSLKWRFQTYIMGILNTTPDSFSDGGLHSNVIAALSHVHRMVDEGADIIDIGGQSTRPGAEEVTLDEEISRVFPIIKAIRSHSEKTVRNVIISVDTYRSVVADAAMEAGADMINDVSGGERDEHMLTIMAKWNCPVVLMHSRGDSKTMLCKDMKEYVGGVVEGVRAELAQRVEKALQSGIRRWNIIVDPGIGFAKDIEGNLTILRNIAQFGSLPSDSFYLENFPVLCGPSRKAFIGRITSKPDPRERLLGTAAACSACIAGGVSILRVHDVAQMKEVAKVGDAIWRMP